jgi:hypothetical protein
VADGPAVDGGCAPVASGDSGDVDEAQNSEGSSVASTEPSSPSWNAEEKLLEELQAPVCFSYGRLR